MKFTSAFYVLFLSLLIAPYAEASPRKNAIHNLKKEKPNQKPLKKRSSSKAAQIDNSLAQDCPVIAHEVTKNFVTSQSPQYAKHLRTMGKMGSNRLCFDSISSARSAGYRPSGR